MKKNIIGFLVFIILFCVGFQRISFILGDKYSYQMYYDFYNDDTEYDILFAGASHSKNSIFPIDLYRDYGIKSYNIANANETIPTSYWTIKTAIKKHKPKIIVFEIFNDGWGNKILPDQEEFMYTYYYTLPFSIDKYKAYFDLLDDSNRTQFLFPLSLFHYRWENLYHDDFDLNHFSENGFEPLLHSQWFDYTYDEIIDTDNYIVRPLAKEYLDKIRKLCEENGIKLIIFQAPFCVENPEHETAIGYQNYAKQNNLDYYGLLGTDKVNYEMDMADTGHLNISGAKRVTDLMGKFLIENYSDYLDLSRNDFWDAKIIESDGYWNYMLENHDILEELILIGITRFKVILSFGNSASSIKYNHLIKTIIDSKEVVVDNSIKCDKELCVFVYDKENNLLVEHKYNDAGNLIE